MSLLEAHELSVEFRAKKGLLGSIPVRALDGVSISLEEGESLAIVGESGSGKTTLARACLRLINLSGGTVLFDGEDISRRSEKELKPFRRRAQAIFQDPYSSLDPYMTVGQIVEEPLIIHGIDVQSQNGSNCTKPWKR